MASVIIPFVFSYCRLFQATDQPNISAANRLLFSVKSSETVSLSLEWELIKWLCCCGSEQYGIINLSSLFYRTMNSQPLITKILLFINISMTQNVFFYPHLYYCSCVSLMGKPSRFNKGCHGAQTVLFL